MTKLENCIIVNGLCTKNHCHLCDKKTDGGCICRDCILGAREGWQEHYWNHIKEGIPNTNCKLCTESKSI